MIILAALILLGSPEADVARIYGEPDINRMSMMDYIGDGMNNFEMKMLMNIYLDSLETRLNWLNSQLAQEFNGCPELLNNLEQSHELFMAESHAWALLAEERMWWDTKQCERFDGTARGYTYAFTLGKRFWYRICEYSWMLEFGASQEDGPNMEPTGIGGYYP